MLVFLEREVVEPTEVAVDRGRERLGASLPAVMGYLDGMQSYTGALADKDKDDEKLSRSSEHWETLDT